MSNDRQPRQDADVCVIGGGVAGGLVAYSLAKQGYDVVILEAGPWLSMDSTSRFDRMEKYLRPDRDAAWSAGVDPERDLYTASLPPYISNFWRSRRVKAVCGTTLHWSAGCYRFHEKDFNMESRYGLATDWPINYADLRPYYAKAEAELGVAHRDDNPFIPRKEPTPMDGHPPTTTDRLLEEACEQLGIRTHGLPVAINTEAYDGRSQCLGFSTCRACPSGAKYSGDVHIRKAEEHGARVIDQAHVLELHHDSSGEYVDRARYITPNGTKYNQTADHFVLCCGGIETPRLLLLSTSEAYPGGLANSSGTVGKYFFSTPEISTTAVINADLEPESVFFNTTHTQEFYDNEAEDSGSFQLNFTNENFESVVTEAIGGESRFSYVTNMPNGDLYGDQLSEKLRDRTQTCKQKLKISSQIEMLPSEENSVTLNDTKTDKYGKPVPHVTYDVGSHALQSIETSLEKQKKIFSAMDAEVIEVEGKEDLSIGSHHKGTTRMGSDPTKNVVNSALRTHDLENLWISSSSVFPTGGAVSPTLTIAALSLKASEHIEERL